MMSRSLRVLALVVLPLGPGVGEAAPPQGTPLLIHLPPEALPLDVSASGFVSVGGFFSGGAMHWMPTSGAQRLGGLQAIAVSRDGKTIVGEALDARGLQNAAIWSGGTSWRTLGSFTPAARPCDFDLSVALGTSADGQVVVGLGWDGCALARAFRWEESTGMVNLGSLSGQSTRANGISGDGRVVIGWEESNGPRLGAKWVERTQEMIQGPFGPVGEALRRQPRRLDHRGRPLQLQRSTRRPPGNGRRPASSASPSSGRATFPTCPTARSCWAPATTDA